MCVCILYTFPWDEVLSAGLLAVLNSGWSGVSVGQGLVRLLLNAAIRPGVWGQRHLFFVSHVIYFCFGALRKNNNNNNNNKKNAPELR